MDTPLHKKSSVKEIKERFDNDVERFSNLETGQQATIDAPLAMELITQAAASNNPEAKNMLDIGCGAGNNTLKLLEQINPLNCDLVDLSKPMLERAYSRISAVNNGNTRLIQTDFRDARLPHEHYDIIIAAAVLHHLRDDSDWEKAFRKIYNLTAPGGSVWITDMVSHEINATLQMMWNRYGTYLESRGGPAYRNKVFRYIDKEDSPRPVTYQLDMLRRVGFGRVDILHKNSCFAAFGALKDKR
ncbi:MAG TPA: methyltransferase domain-containing protein [Balneolaceae bacterium]|nr:methyltransferase domain-containing protein [Balneolaceae bacterium]